MIKRALLSVHDKTGLRELASALAAHGIEMIATGGTAGFLLDHGFKVTSLEDVTGFPEILDGRVKTLHPKIFGGLLARREVGTHLEELETHGIRLIDLVVVNLYPFREVISRPGTALAEALENIDIGGVALIRAAAKNFPDVAVVTAPRQYAEVTGELQSNHGALSLQTRRKLAAAAFAHTAVYDSEIQAYLHAQEPAAELPDQLALGFDKVRDLRYGENPHQRAAFYRDYLSREAGFAGAQQLQGKEISYNNLADADAALQIVRSFRAPSCVIIKHANPSGVATGEKLAQAYEKARAADPVAAFGGIVGCNREVDGETARKITAVFAEVVLAPSFSVEALQIFSDKKNLRLLQMPETTGTAPPGFELKNIAGGILAQERDLAREEGELFKVVTLRPPSAQETAALLFGWQVVRWVKSNAIVFCREDRTLGLGAGQMSRIDSVKLAITKAQAAGLDLMGTAMASDAFFPFADGVETAAAAGATAVIQPGGAQRDAEVIAAADRHDMTMIFTGLRHFRH
ncbi:MAG: bifunctional phosphoribosylaminoimidazolecarboxamide formyltransferase/IMP cyclohydrolase [bacterium]